VPVASRKSHERVCECAAAGRGVVCSHLLESDKNLAKMHKMVERLILLSILSSMINLEVIQLCSSSRAHAAADERTLPGKC